MARPPHANLLVRSARRASLRAVVARLLGRRGAGQIANDPSSYETRIRAAVPAFDAFQDTVAEATRGLDARLVLDLGIGTGETARRVLELHPRGHLVGIDRSVSMANSARVALPQDRVDVRVGRLEDPLPKVASISSSPRSPFITSQRQARPISLPVSHPLCAQAASSFWATSSSPRMPRIK